MGCQSQSKLPVIDLSQVDLTSTEWISTSHAICRALEEYGCFQAIYSKLPLEIHSKLFAAVEEVFSLPTKVKIKNTGDKPYHGYYGQYAAIPLYESLGIDNPLSEQSLGSFAKIMWPDEDRSHFCESVKLFSEILTQLDQMVTRMVFQNYGVEDYYDSHIGSTNYLFRCFKYRVPKEEETNVGIYSHTDKTFTTILHQSRINGLEIKTKDGEWISVEPSPSSFVVMAGEALMAWSNDRIRSCDHRVIMYAKEARYSLGMFSFLNGMVHVPEELGSVANPLRYKSFDHYGYLRFHYSGEAKKFESPLKAYCGV